MPEAVVAPAPVRALSPLVAPAGFLLAVPFEAVTGSSLVVRMVLFRWPTDGWVRGKVTVARRSRAGLEKRGGGLAKVCRGVEK